jgi:hypothetical protein
MMERMTQPLLVHRPDGEGLQTVDKGQWAASVQEIRPQALQQTLGREILESLREEVALISVRNHQGSRQLIVGRRTSPRPTTPHLPMPLSHDAAPIPTSLGLPLPRSFS